MHTFGFSLLGKKASENLEGIVSKHLTLNPRYRVSVLTRFVDVAFYLMEIKI